MGIKSISKTLRLDKARKLLTCFPSLSPTKKEVKLSIRDRIKHENKDLGTGTVKATDSEIKKPKPLDTNNSVTEIQTAPQVQTDFTELEEKKNQITPEIPVSSHPKGMPHLNPLKSNLGGKGTNEIIKDLDTTTSKSKLLDHLLKISPTDAPHIFKLCSSETLDKISTLGASNPHYKILKDVISQINKKFQLMPLEELLSLPRNSPNYDFAQKHLERKAINLVSGMELKALFNPKNIQERNGFYKKILPYIKEKNKKDTELFISRKKASLPVLEGQYTSILATNLEKTFKLVEKFIPEVQTEFAQQIFSTLSRETLENICDLDGSKIMPSVPYINIAKDCLIQKQEEDRFLIHRKEITDQILLNSLDNTEHKFLPRYSFQEAMENIIEITAEIDADKLNKLQDPKQIAKHLESLFSSPLNVPHQIYKSLQEDYPDHALEVPHRDYAIAIFSYASIQTLETISTLEHHPLTPHIWLAKQYLEIKKDELAKHHLEIEQKYRKKKSAIIAEEKPSPLVETIKTDAKIDINVYDYSTIDDFIEPSSGITLRQEVKETELLNAPVAENKNIISPHEQRQLITNATKADMKQSISPNDTALNALIKHSRTLTKDDLEIYAQNILEERSEADINLMEEKLKKENIPSQTLDIITQLFIVVKQEKKLQEMFNNPSTSFTKKEKDADQKTVSTIGTIDWDKENEKAKKQARKTQDLMNPNFIPKTS